MKTFHLRAHHLLCIQGFQNLGYSPEFVKNMKSIVDEILSHPEKVMLKLSAGLDDICAACPHRGKETCDKDGEANARMVGSDEMTLKKLNLKNPTQKRADDLIALANNKLKSRHDAIGICNTCPWREKCLWYLKLNS